MKNKSMKEQMRLLAGKIAAVAAASALVIGCGYVSENARYPMPTELTVNVDAESVVNITEDDVPLGPTSKTTDKKTKTTKKKVKLTKASVKTFSKSKTTKKTKTTTKNEATKTTTTVTTTTTKVVDAYTKGSKIDNQTTTVTTVTVKTIKQIDPPSFDKLASKAHPNVTKAFNTLGFKLVMNSSVPYEGLMDSRNRTLTLRVPDDTIYHELGHFVAFISGNADTKSEFKAIFSNEGKLYKEFDRNYILSSPAEYFAQSYKELVVQPAKLAASRPQTYAYVLQAVEKITDDQVSRIGKLYAALWK